MASKSVAGLVQVAFQWGLVGAICFFALGAALMWRAARRMKQGGAEIAPALLVLLGLLVFSLYDGSFYYPYPIVMMTTALVILLSARPSNQVGENWLEASSRV